MTIDSQRFRKVGLLGYFCVDKSLPYLSKTLIEKQVNPNLLTLIGGFLALALLLAAVLPAVIQPYYFTLLCLLILLIDSLDGYCARQLHCTSEKGHFFDATVDQLFKLTFVMTFFLIMPLQQHGVLLVCYLAVGALRDFILQQSYTYSVDVESMAGGGRALGLRLYRFTAFLFNRNDSVYLGLVIVLFFPACALSYCYYLLAGELVLAISALYKLTHYFYD